MRSLARPGHQAVETQWHAEGHVVHDAHRQGTHRESPLELFALYVLRPGHAASLSSSSGARAMLMGGGAFATPRHVFWNFVSSSRERINQAKEDWKAMRFPLIPGDDEEFIPLPDKPKTVSYP